MSFQKGACILFRGRNSSGFLSGYNVCCPLASKAVAPEEYISLSVSSRTNGPHLASGIAAGQAPAHPYCLVVCHFLLPKVPLHLRCLDTLQDSIENRRGAPHSVRKLKDLTLEPPRAWSRRALRP